MGTRQRITRQGSAVLSVLAADDTFRSAQGLHTELRKQGHRVGLTTVYRHLQALVDQGEIDAARTDDGETVYRRCATRAHHHHVVCRSCGRTVEVSGPQVEAWMLRVAAAEGFTDVAHTVEIFGTCARCTSEEP
ncbi:MAG: transcriptional repressor [Actinomycetota bacterium]|nr:transcriptional repressor [Actinomycetota bacterium]